MKKRVLQALALVMLVLIPPAMVIVWSLRPEPGLYLEFRLYKSLGEGYVEETDVLRSLRNTTSCILMDIVMPEHAEPLVAGCYKGVPIIRIPYSVIEPYIKEWRTLLSSWGVPAENVLNHEVGLLTRLLVFNSTSNEILYYVLDSIPITLGDFDASHAVHYVIYARRGVQQVSYEKEVISFSAPNKLSPYEDLTTRAVVRASGWSCSCGEFYCYCEELVVRSTPDDMTQYLPSNYFTVVNGTRFMKTPILLIYNQYGSSGYVTASINIESLDAEVGARLTFSTGEITSKIAYGLLPSASFSLGSRTWGGKKYYYTRNLAVAPEEVRWAYIWARPIYEIYKTYYCYLSDCEYLGDVARAYISNVWVVGQYIQGGKESGWPDNAIMNSFFSGTNMTWVVIPDTPLNDGGLQPGESIALQSIVKYCDSCGDGFEVGIPAGAMLGLFVCSALGFGVGTPACEALLTFAGAFEISLELVPAEIRISGSLENEGSYNGIGYNITEYVFMAISKYKYKVPPPWWCPWCTPCEYKVPAGIYFRLV